MLSLTYYLVTTPKSFHFLISLNSVLMYKKKIRLATLPLSYGHKLLANCLTDITHLGGEGLVGCV